MIISASRRTDIPAFYADWFMNRVADGYVVTQNPFNANQLSKVLLESSVVDAIVFWTKNAAPLVGRLSELDERGLFYYFQYTLNPYGEDMERSLPDKRMLVDAFKRVADHVGPQRVIWRYDPILLSDAYSVDFHKQAFEDLSKQLEGHTERVVISFLDMDYRNTKVIEQLGITDGSVEEKTELATFVAEVAASRGMKVETCAEDIDLGACGIQHGCCIDAALIEQLTGRPLSAQGHKKDKNQRGLCGCVASIDIGTYNTCLHGCAYCYANYSPGVIATNVSQHDDASPLLLGTCDADAVPLRKDQKSLFEDTSTQLKLL